MVHPRISRKTLLSLLSVVTVVFLIGTSVAVLRANNGSIFPLLVVPIILWSVFFGTAGGLASAVACSVYAVAFVSLVLGRTSTVHYMAIAVGMFLAVGFIVGKLSGLYRRVLEQERIISESKRELHKQLAAKKTLLVEVHHRIKNNMNMVIGLLSLQAASLENPAAVAALNDAARRLKSMGVMYDQLYRSETIHEMSVRDYLVPLVESAVESYHSAARIELNTDVDELVLDTTSLSHIGIAVNELVSNALKHAFAGRDTGTLAVSLRRGEDQVVLTVADDGVGMPESVDPANSTEVGLTVVQAVVQQLNGELTVERAGGTGVSIRFPVPEAEKLWPAGDAEGVTQRSGSDSGLQT